MITRSLKTVEKKKSLNFKLNSEEINFEDNETLFIGRSKYRVDKTTDEKKISAPYQKLFFANAALDNCVGYNWLIEGDNTPISTKQLFYCTKNFYKVLNPEEILDLVINHWDEDWYVSYHRVGQEPESPHPEVSTDIFITPLSEVAKQEEIRNKNQEHLNYFQEELKQHDDKPLFLDKDVKDGSIIQGLCVIEESGEAFRDDEDKIMYSYYNFIDRYTVVPAALEETKKQRLAIGIYQVKCKFIDAQKHTKSSFIFQPYYLKIIEAHLVKNLQGDKPTNKFLTDNFLTVEDYKFDLISKMNILVEKIKLMQLNLIYSIKIFINGLIRTVIYLLVILGLIVSITKIPALWGLITSFFK